MGDTLAFRRESFLIRHTAHDATAVVAGLMQRPTRVVVELLPRGGRVVFATADGERAVVLADRRLDLMIVLLRRPAGLVAGDHVSDDAVRAIVWPRNPVSPGRRSTSSSVAAGAIWSRRGSPGARLIKRAGWWRHAARSRARRDRDDRDVR